MSDPTNPATPDGNTADPSTTTIDWESPDNPYAQRYRDAQSHLTPLQQENARLKALEDDPSAYLELGKTKGWVEFDEPAQEQQEQDPYADRWQRLEAAEARLAEHDARVAAENAAAGEELFHQDLDTWAEADSVKLSKSDHNAIFGLLMQAPDPTQEAAARAIYEAHVAEKKAEREAIEAEIREQMKRPRVPHTPSSGGAETGVRTYDGMTRAEIDRDMAEQVRARSQH
jgi:hypothetical protein